MIAGVRKHNPGLHFAGLAGGGKRIGHDYDDIARLYPSGGGSIEADDTGTGLTGNSICVETLTVVIIDYKDTLTLDDTGRFHEAGINCYAANVVQTGLGDSGAVDF